MTVTKLVSGRCQFPKTALQPLRGPAASLGELRPIHARHPLPEVTFELGLE